MLSPFRFGAQRCLADGTTLWAGADDALLSDVNLDAEVVSGAEVLADAASAGNIEDMQRLLDDWIDMYAADYAGGTAMVAAATAGQTEALRFLLSQSDAHPVDALLLTIRAAAWYGHLPALNEILRLDLGADRPAIVQDALGAASHARQRERLSLHYLLLVLRQMPACLSGSRGRHLSSLLNTSAAL